MKFLFKICFISLFLVISYRFLLGDVFAESDQFITIVNPVRISKYTTDPVASIRSQYGIIKRENLPATWLLTYGAIEHAGVASVVKEMDQQQELGIFMEVTPNFAQAAGVTYNDTGSWHHATSVFLSGYTKEERIKMIDVVFAKFKDEFGYYPKSVGAWWIDSFSLDYMKNKYDIIANLGVADQFSTDGYQVWGQPWSIPFYPSKKHAGIPAATVDNKIDVVTTQWAPRDPLNGYKDSLYSTQDYPLLKLSTDYFNNLLGLYAGKHNNTFGQIVVGLEADLNAAGYEKEFANQMRSVSERGKSGEFEILTMKEFSEWYRRKFPDISPPHTIITRDFLSEPLTTLWYQSPQYRINVLHNHDNGETSILDLRIYSDEIIEPYYNSPNKSFNLAINIPSILDSVSFANDEWKLETGKIKEISAESTNLVMSFESGERFIFSPRKFYASNILRVPNVFKNHPGINVKSGIDETTLEFSSNSLFFENNLTFSDLTPGATHFIKQKKVAGALVVVILAQIILLFLSGNKRWRMAPLLSISLLLILGWLWQSQNSIKYFIPQGEMDALFRLSQLPDGKVIVYDQECLHCSWHTQYRPAAFGNKRGYVNKFGRHPVVYNSSLFTAETREQARSEFKRTNARYIYAVKFEEYVEKVPFSPGDLGIEKVYENANAQVWGVKEK